MAENLYLYLVNGRCVHVTDDWDGNDPVRIGTVDAAGAPDDGEGIEAGEYYRDIHRRTGTVRGDPTINGGYAGSRVVAGATIPIEAALFPDAVSIAPQELIYGVVIQETALPIGPKVSALNVKPSDEVANAKPRTWQKVCTWLVFSCTTGTQKRAFRAASVDGWGDQPPIDD